MAVKEQTRPKTVDSYLDGVPEDARDALEQVRSAIKGAAPEAEEKISYGIPLYKLGGEHLIGFAASKRHLSVYVIDSAVLDKYERELAPFDHEKTKTTVRFTVDNPLPAALVRRIVRTRIAQISR